MGVGLGGILGLGLVTTERWQLFEADIQRFYGLSAAGLSVRRAVSLWRGLPADAPSHGLDGWTVNHELAAQTVEFLDRVRIQVASLTGDKKVRSWRPVQVPRPESVRPRPKRQSLADWVRQFASDVKGGD